MKKLNPILSCALLLLAGAGAACDAPIDGETDPHDEETDLHDVEEIELDPDSASQNDAMDRSFDGDGKFLLYDFDQSRGKAIALLPDGSSLIAGTRPSLVASGKPKQMFVVRLDVNGKIEPTFGFGGTTWHDFQEGASEAAAIVLTPDAKHFYVGGLVQAPGGSQFALAKFDSKNGLLDRSFGGGAVVTDFRSRTREQITALEIDDQGRVVAGGIAFHKDTNNEFALARYRTDGTLDTSFDGDGKVLTNVYSSRYENLNDIHIGPDKLIYAIGDSMVNGKPNMAVARYRTNGALDTRFDEDGKVLILHRDSTSGAALARGPAGCDDCVYVGGTTYSSSRGRNLFVGLLKADGSFYKRRARTEIDFRSSNYEKLTSMYYDRTINRLVLAGTAYVDGRTQLAAAVVDPHGRLEVTFDLDGKLLADFRSVRSFVDGVKLDVQARGGSYDLVMSSTAWMPDGKTYLAAARARIPAGGFERIPGHSFSRGYQPCLPDGCEGDRYCKWTKQTGNGGSFLYGSACLPDDRPEPQPPEEPAPPPPSMPDPPPADMPGLSAIEIYNCSAERHSISVWMATPGKSFSRKGTKGHQYGSNGLCPFGDPLRITVPDGQVADIRIVDPSAAQCRGDDPNSLVCIKDQSYILGRSGGPVGEVIVY